MVSQNTLLDARLNPNSDSTVFIAFQPLVIQTCLPVQVVNRPHQENIFHAIEVKASRSVHGADVKSLLAFVEDYPQAKACLLYGGKERLKINGIPCLPCDDFLRQLVPNSVLPMP